MIVKTRISVKDHDSRFPVYYDSVPLQKPPYTFLQWSYIKLCGTCNPQWACSPDVRSLQMVGWSYDPLYNRRPIPRCWNTRTLSLQELHMWRPISRVTGQRIPQHSIRWTRQLAMQLIHRTHFMLYPAEPSPSFFHGLRIFKPTQHTQHLWQKEEITQKCHL